MDFTLKTNTGNFDLEAGVKMIGPDILVAIWGGEKPHIGAVAAAHPRPSLKDPELVSATASVICFSSHKEDELVKAASEIFAAALNTRVVVTAGIHWDDISVDGIITVIKNSELLIDQVLDKIASAYPSFIKR